MSQTRSTQAAKSPGYDAKTRQSSGLSVPVTSIHKVEADGVRVFYRAAGEPNSPVVLLLHGTYWSRVWAPVLDRLPGRDPAALLARVPFPGAEP